MKSSHFQTDTPQLHTCLSSQHFFFLGDRRQPLLFFFLTLCYACNRQRGAWVIGSHSIKGLPAVLHTACQASSQEPGDRGAGCVHGSRTGRWAGISGLSQVQGHNNLGLQRRSAAQGLCVDCGRLTLEPVKTSFKAMPLLMRMLKYNMIKRPSKVGPRSAELM